MPFEHLSYMERRVITDSFVKRLKQYWMSGDKYSDYYML